MWDEERIATLRRMWDEGCSCGVIALHLEVTRNTIQGKVTRLKLSRRDTTKAMDGRTYQPQQPQHGPRLTIKRKPRAQPEVMGKAEERRRLSDMLAEAVRNTIAGR